ncbi:MAG: AraC family transcriptional regulator [Paenibacillaceae bacterium]|jgi:AraC-like DNA-binding protein|nr:AraC family transcriptional regulator [Paenibacillaceae bacterium]
MTTIPKVSIQYPRREPDYPFHLCTHSLQRDYPSHRHEFLEFSLVLQGGGTETIDGLTHPMKPGTFTFVMPYQIHEIHVDADAAPLVLYNCNFGMELFWAMRDQYWMNKFLLEADPSLPSFVQYEENRLAEIHGLLKEMNEEYEEGGLWRKDLLFADLIKVLILFDRCRRETQPPVPTGHTRHKSGEFLKVLHYVHTHYRQDITLTGIANRFHMSLSRLSEMFKHRIGQNFVDHLHDVRIRHACVLLQSTEMSIAEVAFEVGYGSYSTFFRVFQEHKEMTPTAYRKFVHIR